MVCHWNDSLRHAPVLASVKRRLWRNAEQLGRRIRDTLIEGLAGVEARAPASAMPKSRRDGMLLVSSWLKSACASLHRGAMFSTAIDMRER